MKNIVVFSIVVAGLIGLSGCAPKKSCNTAPKKVVKPVAKKAPVKKVVPAVKVETVVEEKAPEVIEAPVVDSKTSAVR